MVKFNFKRLFALCFGILTLALCINYSIQLASPGNNYTEAYEVYQDVQKQTSIKDLESYLDNKNIEYNIKGSKLTIPKYPSIVYIINQDNETGYLCHSKTMYNFARLDEKDLDIVSIKTEIVDGDVTETISFKENGSSYVKIGNNYYAQPTTSYKTIVIVSFLLTFCILPFVIVEYIGVFFDWLTEKKKKKAIIAKYLENHSKNENCAS